MELLENKNKNNSLTVSFFLFFEIILYACRLALMKFIDQENTTENLINLLLSGFAFKNS